MNNSKLLATFIGMLLFFSCADNQKREQASNWTFKKEIQLPEIAPISVIAQSKFLWLSDVDNNRVVKTDLDGKILEEYPGFQRPMHISMSHSIVYVPEYTADTIKTIADKRVAIFPLLERPDAPAGIAVKDETLAIADFYNHRVILQEGDAVSTFGKEGHQAGELYYPTDVEIFNDKIFVADAYNNRVQVFDKKGNSLAIIGDKNGINVATGLTLANDRLFVTDFFGNRILVYDLEGNLKQILTEGFDNPTDISVVRNELFVTNYGNHSLAVYGLSLP